MTYWEDKIKNTQETYKNQLTAIREKQVKITECTTELVEIETKLKATEQALALLISGNMDKDGTRYPTLANDKKKHQASIEAKKAEIEKYKSELEVLNNTAKTITTSLSFESNFTPKEIEELQDIIIVDNYQNNAFKKTDIMTQYEIQDLSMDLYNTSVKILDRICEPRCYFKADLINFVFLKEYEAFTKQIKPGTIITVEIEKGFRTKVVLLKMELDFDNPTNFPLEFSNRYRLDSGDFEFADLFTDNSRGSSSYDWNKMIAR